MGDGRWETNCSRRSGQINDLHRCLAIPDFENRDAGLQFESCGTGGSRIHHEPAVGLDDELLVGMAIDDDISCITREQLLGLGRAEFVAMTHVDHAAVDGHIDGGREAGVAGFVDVAVDGVYRRDQRQLVEDFVAAHIAGVEDQFDAGKRVVNLWTQQPMRIRNETEPMDGGCGM